jgi:hypothetical protein
MKDLYIDILFPHHLSSFSEALSFFVNGGTYKPFQSNHFYPHRQNNQTADATGGGIRQDNPNFSHQICPADIDVNIFLNVIWDKARCQYNAEDGHHSPVRIPEFGKRFPAVVAALTTFSPCPASLSSRAIFRRQLYQ